MPESKNKSRYETDPEYREHKKERAREWYANNKKKLLRERKRSGYNKEQFAKNKKSWFNRHLRKNYGISIDDYEKMSDMQDGECMICGTDEVGGTADRMVVDHCHKNKYVRGLLCVKCNSGLGMFNDSPELLRAAADYLSESSPHWNDK